MLLAWNLGSPLIVLPGVRMKNRFACVALLGSLFGLRSPPALGQIVNFIQSSSSPSADNRLLDGSVLEIFGVLRSNRPLTLRVDNIHIAPGGVIDAPGLLLLGAQSVNMAGWSRVRGL